MNKAEKKLHLAGAIRNNMGTATIFTPWPGLDLTYRDEMLCRTTAGQQHVEPIVSQWDLHDLDDETIWQVVIENKPVPAQTQQEEPTPETAEKPKASRGNKKK